MNENELSSKIIGAAFAIHSSLGPGLLESVYEKAIAYELATQGLNIQCQLPISFTYKSITMEAAYRVDVMVNDKVIVELKSVELLAPVHYAQTLTYLKLANKKLALLINFNEKHLKAGIHRIVNNLQ